MEGVDRVQFVHNIELPEGFDYINYVLNYFDQLMAIYVHVSPGNYSMKLNRVEGNTMVIDISCSDRALVEQITNHLSTEPDMFSLYQRQFLFRYSTNQLPENTVQLSVITTQ